MTDRPTLRERMAVLEIKMDNMTIRQDNHIHHHEIRDKWMMGVLSGLVVGIILLAIPVFWQWLGGL